MKDIIIFEDGKFGRGSKAKLIKRGNKRVLIEFTKWDYDKEKYVVITEWFKLYIPSYVSCKKEYKHNNKRKDADYIHIETNEFYSDYWQTDEYKKEFKESATEEYFKELFGDK